MRYYYDTEFVDDGQTIDLISIGIVAEDGREYYAINSDADWLAASRHGFVRDNVLVHLPGASRSEDLLPGIPGAFRFYPDLTDSAYRPHWLIANEVRAFITGSRAENELWAYYGAYDHVALAQLFGPMVNLPESIPMYSHDLKVLLEDRGFSADDLRIPNTDLHSAIADARWNRDIYDELLVVS